MIDVLLTEAEEERVDTHVVHAEETVSYEVAAKHHSLKQHEQRWINIKYSWMFNDRR